MDYMLYMYIFWNLIYLDRGHAAYMAFIHRAENPEGLE